jgi:hypothetical protein
MNGLQEPITLYENKVLDGCHRQRACEEAGIRPRFAEFSGSDAGAFVISKDLKRRQLTTSQKAMVLIILREVVSRLEADAVQRRVKNPKKGKHSPIPSQDGIGDDEENRLEQMDAADTEPRQADNKHTTSTTAQLGKLGVDWTRSLSASLT